MQQIDTDYHMSAPLTKLSRRTLADFLNDVDVMDSFYRPLSELVLQRKITEEDDLHKVSKEVEGILWFHGRDLLKKRELHSRSG